MLLQGFLYNFTQLILKGKKGPIKFNIIQNFQHLHHGVILMQAIIYFYRQDQNSTVIYRKIIKMKKPHNYYCHRTYQQDQSILKGYEIIDKIGEGAFGEVFKVFNTQTSCIEVVKKNKALNSGSTINRETDILTEMGNSDGFARIKQNDNENGCFVMTLLGESLYDVINRSKMSLVDMKRIGHQCLLRLRELHERGFVHRDLKPQNILLGNQNNPHKIYIVDFGLSNSFKKNAITARKVYEGEIGTIKFCPKASHYGLEQFPKDDLESLGYLLAYICTKRLPWSGLPKDLEEKQKYQQIKRLKQTVSIEKLSNGISCIKKYFKKISQLKIGEKIDYEALFQIFKIQCKDVYCFSFCKPSCFSKLKEEQDGGSSGQGQVYSNHLPSQKLQLKNKLKNFA